MTSVQKEIAQCVCGNVALVLLVIAAMLAIGACDPFITPAVKEWRQVAALSLSAVAAIFATLAFWR